MFSISNIRLLIPTDWQKFETISLEALKIMYNNPNFIKNGRQGQNQDGVDFYLQNGDEIIAAQCKLTSKSIDAKVIFFEIEKARRFIPQISTFYICTTSPRDANLQEIVRCKSLEESFQCYILFWEDIMQQIQSRKDVFAMLFPECLYGDEKVIHDIKVIENLFSTIDLNLIQKTLEEYLPEYILFDFAQYFDAFDECWRSCLSSFYDQRLNDVVGRFYECWNALTSETCIEFQPLNGGMLCGFDKGSPSFRYGVYEEKIHRIQSLKEQMFRSLVEMIQYINNQYPCVDLAKLSLNAIETKQKIACQFKCGDE